MSRPRPGRSGRPGASAPALELGPGVGAARYAPPARCTTSAPHRTGLYRAFSGGCEDPDLRGHRPQLGASKGRDMRRREAWLGPGPPAFSRAARVDATTPPWVPSAWSPRGRVVPPATLLGPAPRCGSAHSAPCKRALSESAALLRPGSHAAPAAPHRTAKRRSRSVENAAAPTPRRALSERGGRRTPELGIGGPEGEPLPGPA